MAETDPIFDQSQMRQAMALAIRGRGAVEPNPLVGCVLVRDGQVLAEGFHERFGGPHAEINALTACRAAGQSPAGATAYVTLEPCCHTNKKTPPCLPALLEAKLARVVVGCPDPNPQVAGRGIQQLRDAGLEVDLSSLESECQQLIAPYIAGTLHHRPYVTLKWARSADGKVAGAGGRRFQISNARSMRIVHELRGRCDAIMVGCHTVQWDDPLLTARDVANPRSLLRVVVDSELQTPIESQLVQTAKKWPVIIYCVWKGWDEGQTHQELGVEIVTVGAGRNRRVDLREVLTDLAARGVTHLLVEPGPALARSFLNENLADRVWVFDSPKAIGEPDSPHAPDVPYPVTASHDVDGDILTEYLNPQSAAFFANLPSPDFHLAMSPL